MCELSQLMKWQLKEKDYEHLVWTDPGGLRNGLSSRALRGGLRLFGGLYGRRAG